MRRIHLICNAHIDPIWQWTWDEGISAAIATFKSAVNLADEFDYIFCHNESLIYEDIERKAPELFEKIRALVKQGKLVITGGWYLQPDCILPSGESIVRQIEVGREYFDEKFGVRPTIATNYDSFGFSLGLVQILKKCGYTGMLVCRPNAQTQYHFPSKFFEWRAPDGSSIVVSNSASYNSALGKATEKIEWVAKGESVGMLGSSAQGKTDELSDVDYVLWGVGNHGGGPSRKDLADIQNLKIDGVELLHSSPETLFADAIKVGGVVKESLTPCMPGCYSTMARMKALHRKTENLFYATEKMLSVAALYGFQKDMERLKFAEKKFLLCEFHDILPGTVIDDGEEDGIGMLSAASCIVKDYRSDAFLYLAMRERIAEEGEFPIFVFNYMPYEITTPIEAEFTLADQNWSEEYYYEPHIYYNGKELPCQTIKERSTLNLDWRKRIVFTAPLQPLGLTRFSVRVQKKPIVRKKFSACDLGDFIKGNSLLSAPVFLEMYDDTADPWAMSIEELKGLGKNPRLFQVMDDKKCSEFCGFAGDIAPVHIIEDGEIFTAVECLYSCENTNAAVEYRFYKNEPFIDLKVTVEYAEKNKLVRLKIPAPLGEPYGDGPYLVEKKPKIREMYYHKWCGVKTGEDEYFAALNDGVYGGKAEDGALSITLLRGAGYCFHPINDRELYPHDRYLKRIENGRYEYHFRIMKGTCGEISAKAAEFNEPPYALNVFPTGTGISGVKVQTDCPVVMPVFRKKGEGYEMRFYNPENIGKEFTLTICEKTKKIAMKPYEIVTVLVQEEIEVLHDKIL